jgi:glutamate 5-kinase
MAAEKVVLLPQDTTTLNYTGLRQTSGLGPLGEEIGRGLVNYNAEEVRAMRGAHSSEIAARIGYRNFDEVIHRDNLVVLSP